MDKFYGISKRGSKTSSADDVLVKTYKTKPLFIYPI